MSISKRFFCIITAIDRNEVVITSFKSTPFWPTFYQFLTIFLYPVQKLPLKHRAWTSWWYYIFLERKKIYEQSAILSTKTGLLYSLCEFFASSRALARRRRPCEPFPRASWEPFPLALCARVAPHEPCTLHCGTQRHISAQTPSAYVILAFTSPCYISHVCRPTAACSFYIRSHIFSQWTIQRTLETVCVIDDKTKYSARWFPYFWRT